MKQELYKMMLNNQWKIFLNKNIQKILKNQKPNTKPNINYWYRYIYIIGSLNKVKSFTKITFKLIIELIYLST